MFFIANSVFANKSSKEQEYKIKFKYELMASYDNNILNYSDKYIDYFKQGKQEGRFDLETIDDIIFKNALSVSIKKDFIKNLTTELTGQISRRGYITNPQKSWFYGNIGLSQELSNKLKIKVAYSVIPNFYVRNYRDEDIKYSFYTDDVYVPFEFAKENYYTWIYYDVFSKTKLGLNLSYQRYFYNKHFTEYDQNKYLIGLKVSHSYNKEIKLSLGVNVLSSNAKAYDQDFETANTSDDADASYDGANIGLGIDWRLPKLFKHKNSIDFAFKYNRNFFNTSSTPTKDVLHSGRVDNILVGGASYEFEYDKSISFLLNYHFYHRNAMSVNSANENYISEEKDYNKHRVGLGIIYKIQ